MKNINEKIEDWERIRDLFKLAKDNEGELKKSFRVLAYQKIKDYNSEYNTKYDFFNKPEEVL